MVHVWAKVGVVHIEHGGAGVDDVQHRGAGVVQGQGRGVAVLPVVSSDPV